MPADYSPLWLSLRVAGLSTVVSLIAGVWLGHRLRDNAGLSAAAALPLALPPTIVCSYFLFPRFDWRIAAAAGVVFALPLLMRASRSAFRHVNHDCENAARGMGASEWRLFWWITLPLAWRPIAAATALAFARVLTEFAATLLIVARFSKLAGPRP